MEKVQWKVDGMTCANCALTINKFLQQKGATNISVNAIGGDVSFDLNDKFTKQQLAKGIESLGYTVENSEQKITIVRRGFLTNHWQRFLFCLPFTLLLVMNMIPGINIHFLMDPYIQLILTMPVFILGMHFFGRSAIRSLRNGIPNMNVLITCGASAAFFYSLVASFMHLGEEYLFYETSATIITLIFLGNFVEDASMRSTQASLDKLVRAQKVMANMIAFDEHHQELIFPIDSGQLKSGDLILINTGEQVPADSKILWGEAYINESLLTGESMPVFKKKKDMIIGGSVVEQGTIKAQVTAAGNETVLSAILNLVRKAQGEKPPVQQLADRISAIFVPVVLVIALITFIGNWLVLKEFTPSLIRSITVLVIACPCAMGLATPAAIAVGLGRGARNGILYRNAKSLEVFTQIKHVIFDKTGTLTTGNFEISEFKFFHVSDEEFRRIVYSLEKFSSHPIAKSLTNIWKVKSAISWKTVEEIRGLGVKGTDLEGNTYFAGAFSPGLNMGNESGHNVYVLKNDILIGWIDMQDEIRPEAEKVIKLLHSNNIQTTLLSGDTYAKSMQVAKTLGIESVFAEQKPAQKLQKVQEISAKAPSIMIGDGINDAPALAKATIGISMSGSSQLAMQSAEVVIMDNGLSKLPLTIWLGRQTYKTIKQNLFWAFSYNIITIPLAIIGILGKFAPSYGAFIMAFSDVILAANSLLLYHKKFRGSDI